MRLRLYPFALLLPCFLQSSYETVSLQASIGPIEDVSSSFIPFSPPSSKEISHYSNAGLLHIISFTKNCSDSREASLEIIQRMKIEEKLELFLGLHSHVYTLDKQITFTLEDYVARSSLPFVIHSSSPYFSPILEGFPKKLKEEFSQLDIYFIFNPFILNCAFRKPLQNVLAITYQPEMIIHVKNDSNHSFLISSLVAHEIEHTKDFGKNLLEKERNAIRMELETLYVQKKSTQSKDYNDRIAYLQSRFESAEYLSKKKFKDVFAKVYPPSIILSSSLLEANLSQNVLLPYAEKVSTGNPKKDQELAYASEIAVITLQIPPEERLSKLEAILDSPDLDSLKKMNVEAALAFFSPIKENKNIYLEYPDFPEGNSFYLLSEEKSHIHLVGSSLFSASFQE